MTTIPSFTRVTSLLSGNLFLQNYMESMRRLTKVQQQASTGKRLLTPSDDAIGTRMSMEYENSILRANTYLKNVSRSSSELAYVDGSLDGVGNIMQKAQQIVTSMLNDPNSSERKNVAQEVTQLIDELVKIANSQYNNKYLFGGFGTGEAPFKKDADGNIIYTGTDNEKFIEISRALTMATVPAGSEIFGALSASIKGTDMNPALSLSTKLASLNNSTGGPSGVRGDRICVTLGPAGSETKYYIDLSEANDIQDVKNIIETETSAAVSVNINATNDGIIVTAAPPIEMSISSMAGGKTAEDLGIAGQSPVGVINGTDLDPAVTKHTLLDDLLGGGGAFDKTGFVLNVGNDSRVIDLSGSNTVEDMLNLVKLSGLHASARITEDGRAVEITCALSGARISIGENGPGNTASDLGIYFGLAETPLSSLKNGLGVDTSAGTDFTIQTRSGANIAIDLSTAKTVQDVIDIINNNPANQNPPGTFVTAMLNAAGDGLDIIDNTAGANDFVIARANSFAATNLGIEQNAGAGGVINGTQLTPAGVIAKNIFSGLKMLQDGLLADDDMLLYAAQPLLDEGFERVLGERAKIGSRMNRLELATNRLEMEVEHMSKFLSEITDADLAETITKLDQEQLVIQAALSVMGKIASTTLLNYL